jgi:Na+-driven multidrug efflux pump
VALVVATTIAVTWICLRNYVGDIFSSDPDVQSYASHLAFLCGGAYLAICVFYVCMGILEGQVGMVFFG